MIPTMQVTLSTTSQVADRLNVDASTVRAWAIASKIPYAAKTPGGHYRFRLTDVEAALSSPSASAAFNAGVEGVSLSAETAT